MNFMLFFRCLTWIRTKTYRTKICCTTLILSGNPFLLGCKNKGVIIINQKNLLKLFELL